MRSPSLAAITAHSVHMSQLRGTSLQEGTVTSTLLHVVPDETYNALQALIRAHERQHYSPILRSTKAIFFFGTPHRGSEFANHILRAAPLLDLVDNGFIEFFGGQGRLVRQDLIDNLTTKAPILDDLTRSFVERADELSVIVSFQETRKIRGQMVCTRL